MMYKDLYSAVPASMCIRGHRPQRATLGLFWANTRPAEINLSIRCGEDYQVWFVARSTFIAADQEWARGSWIGAGGWFAVCHAANQCLLMLREHAGHQAILFTPGQAITAFIEHTQAIVPAGDPETEVTMHQVDKAIKEILNG